MSGDAVHPPIAHRLFDEAEQQRFTASSGDRNPIHLDPVAARRTQAGAPVVHGMHAALWALDALVEAGCIRRPVASIDVEFEKFVYVGSNVALRVARDTETRLRAELDVDGLRTTVLTIGYDPKASGHAVAPDAEPIEVPATPRALDVDDLANLSGRLQQFDGRPNARLFAHAEAAIGAERVEALALLSTIVGMICPGLHSIFRSASVAIVDGTASTRGVAFATRSVDERFRMVELAASGSGIAATLTAFLRRPPVAQPSSTRVAEFVRSAEFSKTTALIAGGSRGLGALTARALAAGGARVVVTYRLGETEAREIASEIGARKCRILRYDVLDAAAPQLAELDWDIDQLYYFATPQIFRQKASVFSPSLFAEYCEYYASGFDRLCTALLGRRARLSAFYPSSAAVEERPRGMTEYAMAKAAGETLCADLNRFARGLKIIVRRLPRLLTDQTATVMPSEYDDPLTVMLPIVREMHG